MGVINIMGEKISDKRIKYTICFLILLVIEVLIALFVHDRFVRPYLGDILVVVVIYFFIRIIFPEKLKLLPLYIFIFASLIEILQYFDIVTMLGLENNKFFRVLIGSTFDIKDILCYGVGCILIAVIEYVKR